LFNLIVVFETKMNMAPIPHLTVSLVSLNVKVKVISSVQTSWHAVP